MSLLARLLGEGKAELRAENEMLRTGLRLAFEALRRHDDWCGYNTDAPGDSSFNRAWDAWDTIRQRQKLASGWETSDG